MIEIPGIVLSRPLTAGGEPKGTRFTGQTMIAGFPFWVDVLEVIPPNPMEDDYVRGATEVNEKMLTDAYNAVGMDNGDWPMIPLTGEVDGITLEGKWFMILIYPATT